MKPLKSGWFFVRTCFLKQMAGVLLLCLMPAAFTAPAQEAGGTLDELLRKVLQEREYQNKELKEREKTFQTKRNQQKNLLTEAEKELKRENQINNRLTVEFNKNEKDLVVLENELALAMGIFGELFGVVKQVSGDLRGVVEKSLVSADHPHRLKVIDAIAQSKKQPGIEDLRKLWFEIQREMTETGKVVRFEADVVSLSGQKTTKPVVRVGAFNLISGGRYLKYHDSTGQIVELGRQPAPRFVRTLKGLENTQGNAYTTVAIDPSGGSLLDILLRVPGFWERIQDGGLMGYLIICVLLFGLALAGERFFVLNRERKKMLWQLKHLNTPEAHNPVGQILLSYSKNKHLKPEALDMKLSEVTLRTLPRWERGVGLIKVFAALAPLMGLLGTVVGMIMTFQAITLFGAGDPKAMAGGISQALVTTMLGLYCAIPLLLCHTFVNSRLQFLIHTLEAKTSSLLAEKHTDPPPPAAGGG